MDTGLSTRDVTDHDDGSADRSFSVLGRSGVATGHLDAQPEFFVDLNLDQVVESLTAGKQEYDLLPLFWTPAVDVEMVRNRQAVFADLHGAERPALRNGIEEFATGMRDMRHRLTQATKLRYTLQRQWWFLDAVRVYTSAVTALAETFQTDPPTSEGLQAADGHVRAYCGSAAFNRMRDDADLVHRDLAAIRYTIDVRGSRVTVADYAGEPDYSDRVQATFSKFAQAGTDDYRTAFAEVPDMNHIEAEILDHVQQLNPEPFARLAGISADYSEFIDEQLARMDREMQFYLSYLEYIRPLEQRGLTFCYPRVTDRRDEQSRASFDLALAAQWSRTGKDGEIVTNGFTLRDPERVIIVSGPNQGGKTTFARTFGQLHYLAALGCPVPGERADLLFYDGLYTHFEREETIDTLNGKLQDDLIRIHDILAVATADSVIVLNEIFTSTTLQDAATLGRRVLDRIRTLGALCLCVTFIDELAALAPDTVSMVSTVDPDDAATRTFNIVRAAADGRAYAVAIAEKYGLTYDQLLQRVSA